MLCLKPASLVFLLTGDLQVDCRSFWEVSWWCILLLSQLWESRVCSWCYVKAQFLLGHVGLGVPWPRSTNVPHLLENHKVRDIQNLTLTLSLTNSLSWSYTELAFLFIRSDHPSVVPSSMEMIMITVIDETDEVSTDLLDTLLTSVKKEKQVRLFFSCCKLSSQLDSVN